MKCISLLEDVENLKQTRSPDAKAQITEKISQFFNEGLFEESEMVIAEEVLRLLARDTERKVQFALANTLKSNPNLPHDVAVSLAKGATDVSIPILEFSKVLTDEDLIEIVKSTKEVARWKAVAKRESVSQQVAAALIDTKSGEVINTLLNNSGAEVSEQSMDQILKDFAGNKDLLGVLVKRGGLPVSIAAKLVSKVSGEMQKELTKRYPKLNTADAKSPPQVKAEVIEKAIIEGTTAAKEKVLVDFLTNKGKEKDAHELVEHLLSTGSLTPSIVLRGLCKGDLHFFIHGVARLSGVSADNTRKLILDKGGIGFAKLYEKAGLPKTMYESTKIVLKFAMDEIEKGTIAKEGYAGRIIERIIDGGYDSLLTSMPYLMVLINSPMNDNEDTSH